MKTPAIINPIAIAATGKQATSQIEAAPDVPFNHVLSREVAQRNESANTERSTASTANAAQSAPSTPSPSAPSTPSSQSASKAPAKSGEKDKKADDSDKSKSDASATDTSAQNAPADLLALVASIGQMTGADKAAPTDAKTDPDATLGTDAIKADLAGKLDAKGKVAGELADAKADDDGAVDFAAEMKRGADLQKSSDTLDAKAQSALSASEAAAIEAAAKAIQKPELPVTASAQAVAALTAAQQAAQVNLRAAPGHVMDRLAPQVGTPGWDNALGQRVVWMVAGAEQSASLTLNPPDLGPLQVVLNVSNSTANATFVAAQPEVRQALEAAMPKLRDMLGDAGIQLGQATVSSGMQQNQNGGQAESSPRPSFSGDARADQTVDTQLRVPRGRPVSIGNGLVDTFV